MARTVDRGYGANHKRTRALWAQRLKTLGTLPCARCGKPITNGEPWDLGHTDNRAAYQGPEHAHCNRRAGGLSRASKPAPPAATRRDWT